MNDSWPSWGAGNAEAGGAHAGLTAASGASSFWTGGGLYNGIIATGGKKFLHIFKKKLVREVPRKSNKWACFLVWWGKNHPTPNLQQESTPLHSNILFYNNQLHSILTSSFTKKRLCSILAPSPSTFLNIQTEGPKLTAHSTSLCWNTHTNKTLPCRREDSRLILLPDMRVFFMQEFVCF